MKELLLQAASRGIAPEYVNKLLELFEDSALYFKDQPIKSISRTTSTTPKRTQPSKPTEILSARELEILQLMATGATSKEIANELILSVGTVKKHIINIYTKLDVHKRTMAVTKAQELGLI